MPKNTDKSQIDQKLENILINFSYNLAQYEAENPGKKLPPRIDRLWKETAKFIGIPRP